MSGPVTKIGSPGSRPPYPAPLAILADMKDEVIATVRSSVPPGENWPDLRKTWGFRRDPLTPLLDCYERYGPVFSIRVLFGANVFMIGPEANHFMLVSGRENFSWRKGRMGDLIPLLGDGLLTTDGQFHDTSRALIMPAFHRERVVAAAEVMAAEAAGAADAIDAAEPLDVYHWTRDLAMRIAMQALFGFDPDSNRAEEMAATFERGLGFYGREYPMQLIWGPFTPASRMHADRRRLEELVGAEIARRRERGGGGEADGADILSSLIDATDEDGERLAESHVLDHVLTLLFAGHDTTTSTVSFLAYELARHPEWVKRLRAELDEVCGDREPTTEELFSGLPLLTRAVDETLRLYPPAWIGARRCVHDYEFEGVKVGAGLPVAYSSWVSHRLPDVFENPHDFEPDRFEPEARAKWPRGAYVPFGMGPRVCIGKRFGYTEVHAIAAALIRRFDLELPDDYKLTIQQAPTLSPRGGLPMRLTPA
ncbi:MAG: cytochrome P450 [Solirubrobacterales bacterium]